MTDTTAAPPQTCANCRYFSPVGSQDSQGYGDCRLMPREPAPDTDATSAMAIPGPFPRMYGTDWCGQYKT